MAGRYDEGSSWARSAVLQRPNYLGAQFILAACLAMSGRVEEARVVCARLMQLKPAPRMRIETGFGAYFQEVRKGVLGLLECCASNL